MLLFDSYIVLKVHYQSFFEIPNHSNANFHAETKEFLEIFENASFPKFNFLQVCSSRERHNVDYPVRNFTFLNKVM